MADSLHGEMIALMRMTPAQFQAGWRRGRIAQRLGAAFAWLLLAGLIYLLVRDPLALSDSPPRDLHDTIISAAVTVGLLLVAPFILLLMLVLSLPAKNHWLGSRSLRAVALAGESKLVPVAPDQPVPLAADELPRDIEPFRALKLFASASGALPTLFVLFAVVFLILTGIVVIDLLGPDLMSLSDISSMLQLVVFMLIMGEHLIRISGAPLITEGWGSLLPSRRPRLLAIDDWGIRWRKRGWRTREQTLAWHDITAFCVYRMQRGSGSSVHHYRIYLVMGNDLSFAWGTSDRRQRAARAAGELLSRMVVTRARRPLLDVTEGIETIDVWADEPAKGASQDSEKANQLLARLAEAQSRKDRPFQAQGKLQELLSDLSAKRAGTEEMAALHRETMRASDWAGLPMRPVRLRARFYWLNVLLMLLLAAGMVAMWHINQYHLADYYRALPARIAATTPEFHDPLTSNNYNWPVQAPTATDSTSYQYAYGGYAITGGPPGYTNFVTMDRHLYRDLAVAVTAWQIGAADNDGIGLIARSLDTGAGDDDNIVFYVSPSVGYWNLYHYQPGHQNADDNWQYLAGGESDAIQTGANVTNQLLLVLRGTEYLCYINGQFVGRVVDTTVTGSSPKFGYVGLYINDDTTTGVFNDFTVYDAPPPYQPLSLSY